MEEWQVQSASSIISKTFEITEYTVNSRAVRYEIAKGNLRRDFPDIVRKLEAMDMGTSAEYFEGRLVIIVYEVKMKKSGWTSSVHIPRILFAAAIALVMVDAKKLNLVHLDSSKKSLEYILKTRGQRQKITIVSDGSRVLLRPESTILRPE